MTIDPDSFSRGETGDSMAGRQTLTIAFRAECKAPKNVPDYGYYWGDSAPAGKAHERRVASANSAHGFDLDLLRTELVPGKIKVAGTFTLSGWPPLNPADGASHVISWLRFALRLVYRVEHRNTNHIPIEGLILTLREAPKKKDRGAGS